MRLFHIAEAEEWDAAREHGEYRPASLGAEGFIHLSTEGQWLRVACTFYRGRQDLVLVELDASRLSAELRYDAVGDESFPHLYGPLDPTAAIAVHALELGEDGLHRVPDGVGGVHGPPAP